MPATVIYMLSKRPSSICFLQFFSFNLSGYICQVADERPNKTRISEAICILLRQRLPTKRLSIWSSSWSDPADVPSHNETLCQNQAADGGQWWCSGRIYPGSGSAEQQNHWRLVRKLCFICTHYRTRKINAYSYSMSRTHLSSIRKMDCRASRSWN
jgi:hypothetical protein